MPVFAQNLLDEKNSEIDDLTEQLEQLRSDDRQHEIHRLVRFYSEEPVWTGYLFSGLPAVHTKLFHYLHCLSVDLKLFVRALGLYICVQLWELGADKELILTVKDS